MPGKHFDLDTDVLLGGESSSDITIASQKATKTYIDTKNSGKQDKLTAGNNIKIENNVISVDGVSAELSELTDTTITNPTDGQGLIYNKTTNKWENKDIEVPSKTSELTNDSGFITKAVDDLENYTSTTDLNTALDKKAEKEHTHTKSDITDFPINVSEFTNDAGYLTEHQDISGKQDVINAENKLGADLVDDSTSTNKFVTESEKTAWSGKQDKIADLETIRSNASKGATAVQPDDLATVATSGDYKDLSNVPTKVSEFTNDAGYLTGSDISSVFVYQGTKATVEELPETGNKKGDVWTVTADGSEYVWNGTAWEYLGETLDLSGYQTLISDTNKLSADLVDDSTTTNKFVTASEKSTWSGKQDNIADLDDIRSGAHLGATALQSIPDEYITETELESKGYLTSYTETDPVYMADKPNIALKSEIPDVSNLATKDEIPDISGKQDVIADLADIRTNANAGADAANTIAGYGDVVTHNASEFAKASHGHIITDITDLQTTLNGKQNTIADLETIRSNASEGKTANDTIATYGDIVTHNASEFLTEHQDISGKQDKITSTNKLSSDLVDDSNATNKFVTAAEKTTWSGKQDKIDDLETIRTNAANGTALSTQVNTNKEDIAGIKTDLNNYLPLSGGTITGDISPNLDNTVSLGTDALRFKEIYAHELKLSTNSLYLGDTKILGTDANTINIKADAGQSLALKSQGSGLTNVQSFTGVTIETIAENGTNPDGSIIKLKALGDGSSISMIAPTIGITGATTVSNLTVTGNLNVDGTTTTISSQNLEVKDNIIEINKGENGAGVSKGTAGIKIDRGEKTDFFIVYDETDTKLKAGIGKENVKAIATEEFVTNITDLKLDATATATSAAKLTTNAGNATQPVYFNNGVPVATTYTLSANVPADAKFTDTTYTASNGVTITGTNITNSGVRSVTAGTSNGTIKVDTNGTATEVAVTGLGSAAYTSSDAYATATHGHAIADVTGLQDSLDGKQANITLTNKLSADLLADGTTNKVVTATEKTTWNAKQNAISDLDTIRTNASAGKGAADTIATYGDIVSHNAVDFAEAVHTHEIADVNGLQTSLNGKQATITSTNKLSADLLAEGTTNKLVSATEKATWSGKQDALSTTQIENIAKGGTAVQPENLATVATSGSYNDLSDKPAIPSEVTETTVSGWGFTKNVGTITGITLNGVSQGTSGVVDLGTVVTTAGTGLSLSGTTLNHDSSITAGTVGTSSETSGATLAVPYVTYNASGHVTATGTHIHTITGFAATSHNQASNTINALTGYTKATESAAISDSDSLNTALGKLEYKCEHATASQILVGMIP